MLQNCRKEAQKTQEGREDCLVLCVLCFFAANFGFGMVLTISLPNTTRLPRLHRGGLGALWTNASHVLYPQNPLRSLFLIRQAYPHRFTAAFLRQNNSDAGQPCGRRLHGSSGSVGHWNGGGCSQAATNLQERDTSRNTRNTRRANRQEVCFPRIPQLSLLTFSCVLFYFQVSSFIFGPLPCLQRSPGGGCVPQEVWRGVCIGH
jgi:hypothetical protein